MTTKRHLTAVPPFAASDQEDQIPIDAQDEESLCADCRTLVPLGADCYAV